LTSIWGGVVSVAAVATFVAVLVHGLAIVVLMAAIVGITVAVAIIVAPGRLRWKLSAGVAAVVIIAAAAFGVTRTGHHTSAASPGSSATARPGAGKSAPPHAAAAATPAPCATGTGATAQAPFATLSGPDGDPVVTVAFSPGGQLAVGSLNATYPSGSYPINHGGGLALWDVACVGVATYHPTLVPDAGTKGVVEAMFSPSGKYLAVADGNDTTYLWDVSDQTPEPVAEYDDPGQSMDLAGVAFGPGNTVFTADVGGDAYEWQIPATGSAATQPVAGPVATFPGQCGDALDGIAVSPDGRTLAIACYNGNIDVWDIAARTSFTLTDPGSSGVVAVAFGGHDDSILASGDNNGHTYLWNLTSQRLLGPLLATSTAQEVKMMAFNPDGTILLTADAQGYVYAWSVGDRTLLATLRPADGKSVFSVAFSSSGTSFAAGDYGGEASVWNTSSLNLAR
jgi:WD40 repeat protein